MSATEEKLTPLMQQYSAIKNQYADALLFFQVGDFYELFFDDAKAAASFLGIALTKRGTCRGEPVPLCGVPIHALDHYLSKLVKGGYKVALCDQLELPKPGTIVKRGVTQVLTPGTLTDAKLLDDKSSSYLFSFFPADDRWGLLFGELLTARLFGTIVPANSEKILEAELGRFMPDEIVLPAQATTFKRCFSHQGYCASLLDFDMHDEREQQAMEKWLQQQFASPLCAQLSMAEYQSLRSALYYFYAYVRRNQEAALAQFRSLHIYEPDNFLVLDAATQRNIELVRNAHDGGRNNTLFQIVDHAQTAMGSRTIKKWLLSPLIDRRALEQRHDAVHALVVDPIFLQQIIDALGTIGDLERLVGRIALGRATVHDYIALKRMIDALPKLRSLLTQTERAPLLTMIGMQLEDFSALAKLLHDALNDDESYEAIIRIGFDAQLDELRDLVNHAQERLLALEQEEQAKTKISSLKIRYNQVFGYSFEVTKPNLHLVPDYFVRQQTLSGKERFTSAALQQLEHDITHARNAIDEIEREVFARVKQEVATYIHALRMAAYALSRLDALVGFADVAYANGYVRPQFHDGRDIIIKQGRHPVVEQTLGHQFIANDCTLTDEQLLWIITGPNMGGKSTFLRQVALISILAQAGSFVPAQSAKLPIIDRIFTRIGASDNVAQGKSTFLVEMEETAVICTQATERSLVILDEVGRGTSTFDGLAIAQAVVEYLVQTVRACALFATHYHELTLLPEQILGIVNYHATCSKTNKGILFLYKVEPGVADGSFGIDVAKLAELPSSIIARSQEILSHLGATESAPTRKESANSHEQRYLALQLERLEKQLTAHKLMQEQLDAIDLDELSPKKAFDIIWQLKGKQQK